MRNRPSSGKPMVVKEIIIVMKMSAAAPRRVMRGAA